MTGKDIRRRQPTGGSHREAVALPDVNATPYFAQVTPDAASWVGSVTSNFRSHV